MKKFLDKCQEKIIIFDGAMGTNLFDYELKTEDYGALEYEGCPEILNIKRPDIIQEIHRKFFEAGADVVETNSFGSSKLVLAEYGLEDKSYELSFKAARLAREIADSFDTDKYVAGSIGPGTKLASLGNISFDELLDSYESQVQGLLDGGVDLLLIETCQDPLQIKACLNACFRIFQKIEKQFNTIEELFQKYPRAIILDKTKFNLKPKTGLSSQIRFPIHVQVTVETMGTLLVGSDLASALTTLSLYPIDALGMNCATGPKEMEEHIRYLAEHSPFRVSCLPNAGLPESLNGRTYFPLEPEEFGQILETYVRKFGISIVGGCCGTRYEHIQSLAQKISKLKPQQALKSSLEENPIESVSSIYTSVPLIMEPKPLIVGERTNANGSKLFRDLLAKADYDGIVAIAKEQVEEGAHVLDLCTAYVGRDEKKDMIEILKKINTEVNIPIMLDSTEYEVLEEALKYVSGKAIINSVNLEDGEDKVSKIAALANKHGAALVVLTIDENGMAKTAEDKLRIAARLYKLLVDDHGVEAKNLIYDALTFTLASGEEEMRDAGYQTIKGIELIKNKFPEVKTILGLSNISFGLDNRLRPILNSIFLDECIKAGLDLAIASAKKIISLDKIDQLSKKLCLDLIYDQRKDDYDPLHEFIKCADNIRAETKDLNTPYENLSIEEVLAQRIIDGNKNNLDQDLTRALDAGHKALDIINKFLMNGMKIVGEKFRKGEMQLPFVLQSATCMKAAVSFLENFMEKSSEHQSKGSIVLATVKGDVHDIGKNLVDIILSNNGYKVYNLGIKQPIDAILEAVEKYQANVVGMSGLLVKSTHIMKQNLEIMNSRNISIPVILGGSALTRRYVEEDCAQVYSGTVFYGFDAFTDLSLMEKICSGINLEQVKDEFYKSKKKDNIEQINPETNTPYDAVEENNIDNKNFVAKLSQIQSIDQIPQPPFFGRRMVENIDIEDIFHYLNTDALIIGQWRMGKGLQDTVKYQEQMQEQILPLLTRIKNEAKQFDYIQAKIVYGYFRAKIDSNNPNQLNLINENKSLVFPRQSKGENLCLADYFRSEQENLVALQIVTIGSKAANFVNQLYKDNLFDEYLYHYGFATEMTEALAEYAHALIRKELQIDDREDKEIKKLIRGSYHGLRYSFGYPACPDLSDQRILFDLLKPQDIGLELSEEYQIHPEHSTSAIIVHHPDAKYFNIN